MEDVRIDPWNSDQSTDYDLLAEKFGLDSIDMSKIENPSILHTRGLVFAQRDMDVVLQAARSNQPFGVLTGLMPSGRMHLGHTMVIEQAKWYQSHGADVSVAVADLESLATRGVSLDKGRKIALEQYVSNYAAMGLDPDKTQVYFQSTRPEVQRLGFRLGRRTNLSELGAIYGFEGDTNLAHVQAPLVQVGDIVHPMLDEYGGIRPIVVPVGVDQDPHIRLTRDIVSKTQWFNIKQHKSGGLLISLSLQPENLEKFGVSGNGRIDRKARASIFTNIEEKMKKQGFADLNSNPKHGTMTIPAATRYDAIRIRSELSKLEREWGGLGFMAPSSSYHRFAMGLTGGKMSSSKPDTTIFLDDSMEVVRSKIMKAHSGGKTTVEEHRRYGGDLSSDVAYQYLKFFFESDDVELGRIAEEYQSGKILAGEMKNLCADRAEEWLSGLKEKREHWSDRLQEFLAEDAI